MQTGRNWTRKSIEELIDDYLRRKKLPTPASSAQYVNLAGKIGASNFTIVGNTSLYLGVTGSGSLLSPVSGLQADELAVTLPISYVSNRRQTLEYHANNTFYPAICGIPDGELDCIYYLVSTSQYGLPGTYLPTGYRLTKTTAATPHPHINTYEYSYTFTATLTPSQIHSIQSTQTIQQGATAFLLGRNNEFVPGYQAIDTKITNDILPNVSSQYGLMILSNIQLSQADITSVFPSVTQFTDLTY